MSAIIQPRYGEDRHAIGRLVFGRAKALGLSRTDLVRKLGYRDLANGHRALTELLVRGLMLPLIAHNLAAALEVQQHQIDLIIGPTEPRPRSVWPNVAAPPIVFREDEIILRSMTVENGPYRLRTYESFVDADLTCTERITKILTSQFIDYLNGYFIGWRLLQRVETRPARSRGGGYYKIVHYVLSLETDADAATVASHLSKTNYPFDFRYQRIPWNAGETRAMLADRR